MAGFLTDRDLAPSSHRMYTLTMDRLVGQLGPDMPVAEITTTMLARFLATTYAHLAPASYKRVVATLGSLFAYTTPQGATPTSPAAGLKTPPPAVKSGDHARTRAIPQTELLTFLTAEHPVRDKTLWWLLYESAARAQKVLALDIADLDVAHRRAVVIGKTGRAELIGWKPKPPSAAPAAARPAAFRRYRPRTGPPTRPGRSRSHVEKLLTA